MDFKEYMTSEIKGRRNAMEDYSDQRRDLIKKPETNDTSVQLSLTASQIEVENQKLFTETNGKSLSDYYAKIKTTVDTNTLNKKTPNATLKISATSNLGTVDISVS